MALKVWVQLCDTLSYGIPAGFIICAGMADSYCNSKLSYFRDHIRNSLYLRGNCNVADRAFCALLIFLQKRKIRLLQKILRHSPLYSLDKKGPSRWIPRRLAPFLFHLLVFFELINTAAGLFLCIRKHRAQPGGGSISCCETQISHNPLRLRH